MEVTMWLLVVLAVCRTTTATEIVPCPGRENIFTVGNFDEITWEDITDQEKLQDFEFSKDEYWIYPDDHSNQRYLTVFGDDGAPLIEETETLKLKKTEDKKLKTPDSKDTETQNARNPNYVFALDYSQSEECFRLMTTSGRTLFATDLKTVLTYYNASDSDVNVAKVRESAADCWKIIKWEKFIIFESKKFPEHYWKSSLSGLKLVPACDLEIFSGLKTDFVIERVLVESNIDTEIPDGINHYGDILIKYFNPTGHQDQGYICDYQWGTDDANAFCNSKWPGTKGFPTWEGEFNEDKMNVNYTITMVDCSDTDSFDKCTFRTKCSGDINSLCQNTLSLNNGKAFGCSSSQSKIAGVLCGDANTIQELKKKDVECDKNKDSNYKRSIQEMFSLKQQAKDAGEIMTNNKHWSEYLLPIPITVSLISMISLISAQFQNAIKFKRPSNGQWEHLKFDYYAPNLERLQNLMINAFETSDESMLRINSNAKQINQYLENSITYATMDHSSHEKLVKKQILLSNAMTNIENWADENHEKATETIQKFQLTDDFILELIEALKQTKTITKQEKKQLKLKLDRLKEESEKKEEELKKSEEKLASLMEKENAFKDNLKELTLKASKAMCLMNDDCKTPGNVEVDNCIYRKGYMSDNCIELEENLRCATWDEICNSDGYECTKYAMNCTKYEPVCNHRQTQICKKDGDFTCKKWDERTCKERRGWGFEDSVWCVKGNKLGCGNHCGKTWNNPCCKTEGDNGWEECEENKCREWSEPHCPDKEREIQCLEYEIVCDGPEDLECKETEKICVESNHICNERERICSKYEEKKRCAKYESIPSGYFDYSTVDNSFGGCCSGCAGSEKLGNILKRVLEQSLKMETKSLNDDRSAVDLLAILTLTFENMSNITTKIEIFKEEEKKMKENVDMKKTHDKELNQELYPDFVILQQTLPAQINQVSIIAVKNKEGEKSEKLLKELNLKVNEWGDRTLKFTEEETNAIKKFTKKLRKQVKIAEMERNQQSVDPKLESNVVGGSASTIKVISASNDLLETKMKRINEDKNKQLMSSMLMKQVQELRLTKIDVDDYKKTVEFLVDASKYLKKLSQVWGEIKTFFRNVKEMLNKVKQNAGILSQAKENFELDAAVAIDILMEKINEVVVDAYSRNIYMIKVSAFYQEIMQKGLLRKIRGINYERCSEDKCVERMLDAIFKESKSTQEDIKKKISVDQTQLSEQMIKEIDEIKNHLVCSMESSSTEVQNDQMQLIDDMNNKQKTLKQLKEEAETVGNKEPTEDEIETNNLEKEAESTKPFSMGIWK